MYSPITGKEAKVIDSFSIDTIIQGYKERFKIDVSSYFNGMKELPLYECSDSKLRFFYPDKLAGNSAFYTSLENNDFYYRTWKWEYEEAFKIVPQNCKVLDIGCGWGAFLEKLKKEKQCNVFGLEFSTSAYKELERKEIPCSMETIEQHSDQHEGVYDVVTFFQVLEHVSSVRSFLESAVKCLKKDGLLIIAVPNNDPYIFGIHKFEWLNFPPHHMGWWNHESLNNIQNFFPVNTESIKVSPFRDYNQYLDALELDVSIEQPNKLLFTKIGRPFRKQWIQIFRDKIPGFAILGIYRKK